MAQRLPTPGKDEGTWGDILNAYLEVSLASDGTLNNGVVGHSNLDSPTQTTIDSVASKYTLPGSGIPKADLTSIVQISLGKADSSLQSSQLGAVGGIATLDNTSQLNRNQLPSTVVSNSQFLSALSPVFGNVGDGVKGTGGSMTNGAVDLQDSGANWTSADVGKQIIIEKVGGSVTQSSPATLVTTITACLSSTHIQLANPAINTASNAVYHYGTDDYAGLVAAINALNAGTVLDLAGRIFMSSSTLVFSKNRVRITNGAIVSTGYPGVQFTGDEQIADNIKFVGRTDRGTNYTMAASQFAAIQVAGTNFRWLNCKAYGGYFAPLIMGNGLSNGAKILGGLVQGQNLAQNSCGILINTSASGNFDIDIDGVIISGQGWTGATSFGSTGQPTSPYGTSTAGMSGGIMAFDTARCKYRNNRVYGCTKQPTLTMTGWANTSGSVWSCRLAAGNNPGVNGASSDRNDGNTAVIHMNGLEVGGSDYDIGSSPPANSWSQSGGYVYLNVSGSAAASVGPNDGSITILSDTVSGYGITNYGSANNFIAMCDNSVENNTVYATDGFGIYWALHNPLSLSGAATTSGSQMVTMTSTSGLIAGYSISGTNIPFNATIQSVDSSTQIHISANATGTGSGLTLSAGGAFGNSTKGNSLEWACLQGTQDTSLPFAGIGWNGGQENRMMGDSIRTSGGLPGIARNAPGIYMSDGANSVLCTGIAVGVTVDGSASDGFFIGANGWTLEGCTANNNGVNGFNCTTAVASVTWADNQLIGCRAGGNVTGSGITAYAAAGSSAVKMLVSGGEYNNNYLRGILFDNTTDSAIVGAHIHTNNRSATGQPGINMNATLRSIVDGCRINNEATGILLNGINNETIVQGNTVTACTTNGISIASTSSNLTLGPNIWISNGSAITLSTAAPSLVMLPQTFVGNTTSITNVSNLPWVIAGTIGQGDAIWRGSGAPAFAATTGDRYNRIDTPSTANQREYICTSGATPTWVAIL